MPRLTEPERQEVIRFLEADRPLPEKYRFLLFDEKREVELVWNGKTNEVCNLVLPFQTIEQVDEPRVEGVKPRVDPQMSLFETDQRGRQLKGWTNKLIWGDNKLILSSLKNGPLRDEIERQGGLKLIYIDPPFDVGADFSMDIEIGDETFTKKPSILEEIAYRDTWGKGADSFIAMIYERLQLMRDLLSADGSLYLHCDWRVNAFVRCCLDEVFGSHGFVNEIIWKRAHTVKGNIGQGSKYLGANTDSIFVYSKSPDYIFNQQFTPYTDEYINTFFKYSEPDGRKYRLISMIGPGGSAKGNPTYSVLGVTRSWRYSQERMNELLAQGMVVQTSPGTVPQRKQYLDKGDGVSVQCLWDDITGIGASSSERTEYPTQKPERLLERIVETSSNEGDLVADFFCGSGTTAAVAEKLGRKWIVTDLGKFAIHTTRKRMIGVQRQLKDDGKDYRAFEILNLGKYERQHYVGINPNLRDEQQREQLAAKEAAFLGLILKAYRAEKIDGFASFHGKKAGRMVAVGPVNLPVTRRFVEELILECRKKHVTKVDVLGFEFEMGLFPNVLDEARGKGIDIAPKYIPAEVFDKRAVEKDQVVFHDVAFIEVKPHVKAPTKTKPGAVAVELTDFSVFYSQDSVKNAEATLKNKASKVVVDKGKIVKVSKDKDGIVTREVLTKTWTDWIDYWAVDFDYENKREIIRVPKEVNPDAQNWLPGMSPEQKQIVEWEEVWTGDFVFENEWQTFRTKKDRSLELTSAWQECPAGRRKIAVKVVDIFGNDTMTIVEVAVGGKK